MLQFLRPLHWQAVSSLLDPGDPLSFFPRIRSRRRNLMSPGSSRCHVFLQLGQSCDPSAEPLVFLQSLFPLRESVRPDWRQAVPALIVFACCLPFRPDSLPFLKRKAFFYEVPSLVLPREVARCSWKSSRTQEVILISLTRRFPVPLPCWPNLRVVWGKFF